MALVRGRDFIIEIGDGASPEVFTQLGALRTNSLNLNNRPVDVTNKDTTAGFTAWDTATSVKEMQVSGEGFFDDSDSALSRLRTVANSSDPVANFRLVDGTGNRFAGEFVVESFGQEGPTEGPVTYSLTLRNKADIAYEPDA